MNFNELVIRGLIVHQRKKSAHRILTSLSWHRDEHKTAFEINIFQGLLALTYDATTVHFPVLCRRGLGHR